MEEIISIVVPVYNILEYLPRCVQSIRNQTYEKLDIILVDDGSCDGTGELCEQLATEDSRIRVFHKENGGSSSARNLGIKEAKGKYIGFVDSDDYIEKDMYENLFNGIKKYGAEIVQVGRDERSEDGARREDICCVPITLENIQSKEFVKQLLLHKGDCSFCTKLMKRELFAKREFPVGELNEDFKLLVEILTVVDNVISLPYVGYHVFYRIGSNTRKKEKENFSRVFLDCVYNSDHAYRLVKTVFPELEKIALRFQAFQRIEYMLHIPISQMKRDNIEYLKVCKFIKKKWILLMLNKYLTLKNKCYLTLFAIAPCKIRKIHAKMKA